MSHHKARRTADSPPFSVEIIGDGIIVTFRNTALADDFARLEFQSRVLHSLKPDVNHVWRQGSRLDVEIRGFPKWISWNRVSDNRFRGTASTHKPHVLIEYVRILRQALMDVSIGTRDASGTPICKFYIGRNSSWLRYSFHSKARTVAALCVLYDLKPHPRNDLELNVPEELGVQFSSSEGTRQVRTYGDPSKTADVLRNEGWSRIGADIGMKVFRQEVGGAQQQMYQLLRREQHLASQVTRTNIPKRWKLELYESQNYTCQICHNKYSAEYLEPDHRIPVIVRTDELTESNFKEKLMTLCRYCNQAKREACKVLPADHDWATSPWAYPEKFELEKIEQEIVSYAIARQLSKKEILKLLVDKLRL